jgi:hypothetical protein
MEVNMSDNRDNGNLALASRLKILCSAARGGKLVSAKKAFSRPKVWIKLPPGNFGEFFHEFLPASGFVYRSFHAIGANAG